MTKKKNKSFKGIFSNKLLFIASLCFILAFIASFAATTNFIENGDDLSLPDNAIEYEPSGGGGIELRELGIKVNISPQLSKQGLIGVATNSSSSSMTIAFTTKGLAKLNPACNGLKGSIGSMTRYNGSSSQMAEHEHAHGSTNFDFNGFHINFKATSESCVNKDQEYSAEDLKKEAEASNLLWEAMKTAQEL